jgi:23S rRNA pseudouridine955/2504/2580 synthase
MEKKISNPVRSLVVNEDHHDQRIDNYLFSKLKDLPKSRIYRALRKGEVRVNKKRINPDYRLKNKDVIRLPPFKLASDHKWSPAAGHRITELIKKSILLENNDFIILNKPAGIAVHGGSGIKFGVIEVLRSIYLKAKFLELVHRLDKETSGCLLIAKKSSVLKEIHALLTARRVKKTYLLYVAGRCNFNEKIVDTPLQKDRLKSGERIVLENPSGKPAKTIFRCIKHIGEGTLLEASPITGRTHQIRVHAASLGHPILGDEKYGDKEANKALKSLGIHQLCLHASSIEFYLRTSEQEIGVCALLREPWSKLIT